MPALSDYVTGTISLTNGSVDFTGTSTGWLLAGFKEGDTIIDITGATEYMGVVATIDANGAGTLTKAWEGPTLVDVAYRMRFQPDGARVSAQARNLIELLGNGNVLALAGLSGSANQVPMFTGPGAMTLVPKTDLVSGVAYDVQVDLLADRAAYDGQAEGFSVLVADVGDGRAAVYAKASATSGDWSDPAYVTGPVGPLPEVTVGTVTTGNPGTSVIVTPTPTVDGVELDFTIPAGRGPVIEGDYNPATAYVLDDAVLYNGSTFIALGPTTGNPPPTLPTTSNAYWQLLARQGIDGAGTVNSVVAGPGIAVDNTDPTAPIISANAAVSAPQGRLTLSSTTVVPEADIVGAGSIYYLPCAGVYVPIFDGAVFVSRSIGAGLTLDLDGNSGHTGYQEASNCFDLWAVLDGSTVRLATGPSWEAGAVAGSTVARGTGAGSSEIELLDGFYVNANAMTVRFGSSSENTLSVPAQEATYLGTFYAAGDGLATDSKDKRWLDNAYNQAPRSFSRFEDAVSWTYSTVGFRQANDNVNNQVSWVAGLAGKLCDATVHALATSSTSTRRQSSVAIGIDSNTTASPDCHISYSSNASGDFRNMTARWAGYAGLGFHEAKWLESGGGTDTQTFFGEGSPAYRHGIVGGGLF